MPLRLRKLFSGVRVCGRIDTTREATDRTPEEHRTIPRIECASTRQVRQFETWTAAPCAPRGTAAPAQAGPAPPEETARWLQRRNVVATSALPSRVPGTSPPVPPAESLAALPVYHVHDRRISIRNGRDHITTPLVQGEPAKLFLDRGNRNGAPGSKRHSHTMPQLCRCEKAQQPRLRAKFSGIRQARLYRFRMRARYRRSKPSKHCANGRGSPFVRRFLHCVAPLKPFPR
jgi:hypothetical protein